jgi:DEAD/DEAH box helicase domain-containing protein
VSNPSNPAVLAGHLRCAAAELPLTEADSGEFGAGGLELAATLPDLIGTPAGLAYRGADHPSAQVSLRSAGGEAVAVVEAASGTLVGVVDATRADSTVHAGAVYLHMGAQHLVSATDTASRIAFVEPFTGDYYTQAVRRSQTEIVRELDTRDVFGTWVVFGEIEVAEQVLGYQRKRLSDHKPIDQLPLDLPERRFHTQAIWFIPAPWPDADLSLGALHAAEHAMIGLLPLLATADRGDIGGLSTDVHPQTRQPTVFVYDGYPGGAGIAHSGFERFPEWVDRTARLLGDCPCDHGCPSCVQSPKCGNLNEPLSKAGAHALLLSMTGRGRQLAASA